MATVRVMPPLSRSAAGRGELEAAGATLGEVLRSVAAAYPELGRKILDERGRLYAHVIVLVDGRSVAGGCLETTAVGGDSTVDLLEAMAGG